MFNLGALRLPKTKLLDFLRLSRAEPIESVGEIVTGWPLRAGWYWPQPHNDVVPSVAQGAGKGPRRISLPGKPAEFLSELYGTHFGGIAVTEGDARDFMRVPNGRRS